MSAYFSVALSHVFSPFRTVSLLFSDSHMCVHCSMISQSDLSVFTSSLFRTTMIADMLLLSFYEGRTNNTHTHGCHLALNTRQTTWIMSPNHSWIYVCASVPTVDICVFLWGVGECAATGASDWPTGTGARQDGWMHGKANLFILHISYVKAAQSALQITQAKAQDRINKNDKSKQTNAGGIKAIKTNKYTVKKQ